MKGPSTKILVPLDPSEYAHSATVMASRIARAHKAWVTGLTVLDSPDIRKALQPLPYSYMPMMIDAISNHTQHAKAEILQMEKRFAEYCSGQGVDSIEFELEGVAASLIVDTSALYDLMIVGLRTFFHFETHESDDGVMLYDILKQTSTPVLAVMEKPLPVERVLIAYDGSVPSTRALREFALIAKPMGYEVDILVADENSYRMDHLADQSKKYLERKGIPVNGIVRRKDSAMVAIQEGTTAEYDMIVCGVHSRGMIQEMFVGSFTKALIEREENCLFMAH